jgi:hypothetical protein
MSDMRANKIYVSQKIMQIRIVKEYFDGGLYTLETKGVKPTMKTYQPGQILEVEDEKAYEWILAGHAEGVPKNLIQKWKLLLIYCRMFFGLIGGLMIVGALLIVGLGIMFVIGVVFFAIIKWAFTTVFE